VNAYDIRDFQISGGAASQRPGHQLSVHTETKEMPIYALIAGKNGPKLQPSSEGAKGTSMSMGKGQLKLTNGSLQMLSQTIAGIVGRTVIETGITISSSNLRRSKSRFSNPARYWKSNWPNPMAQPSSRRSSNNSAFASKAKKARYKYS
jgi:hypothetical protein